ncbi:hypothetical protein [Pseudoteredinibacter isoporae]|uniref:Uncharacterized protein n=1 Tax=Pseudoteredinibacter isoporae TaxID=570281 RepID=A0A7X0JVR0_9GAMM|nr:hypothetical protein [Pseudoteredinibacter isoporae]MBB6522156.1 hypothetical protein [Pseudoteredinibacter isoporae]NHO87691.1 hypothetical protein [Pseudoteredinibacter isoporae]NIB23978.1 hypothetical protein [Pseudoteredinibacter isoporae]
MVQDLNRRIISIFLVVSVLILSSCASRVSTVQSDTAKPIKNSEGYLLLGLSSNMYLEFIVIDGESKIMFTKDDVRYNSNYLFTALPAGEYRIKSVKTGRYTGYSLLGDIWSFSVAPGTISYVGDFKFERRNWNNDMLIVNRSSYAYEFMKERFPNLLKAHSITYTGQKEDRFFELMQSGEISASKGVEK